MTTASTILLGAGASVPFDIPLMKGFFNEFISVINSRRPQCVPLIAKIQAGHDEASFDLEGLLTGLQTVITMPEGLKILEVADDKVDQQIRVAQELKGYLDAFIIDRCERFDRSGALKALGPFLATSTKFPLQVFSTNYDRIIEFCCEDLDIPYSDGFAGSTTTAISNWSGKFDTNVSLVKLHGSVNWYRNVADNTLHKLDRGYSVPTYEFSLSRRGEAYRPLMIVPTLEKSVSEQPYSALGTRFSDTLRETRVLFIIGNSIRDEHIRSHIRNRLDNLVVVIVDPAASALTSRFERDDRVIPIDVGSKSFFEFVPELYTDLVSSLEKSDSGDTDGAFESCRVFANKVQTAFLSDIRHSTDPEIRQLAISSLEGSVPSRISAITKLGAIGGTHVEKFLTTYLSTDESSAIRIALVDALSNSPSKEATEVFRQFALNDDDRFVRLEAALALKGLSDLSADAKAAWETAQGRPEITDLVGVKP